jgi:hypothetical protein
MRGKCRELLKRNALLEATATKGRRRKNLTTKDLEIAAKEDTIRALGRKYSMTHCLWINTGIFPLRRPPHIDLLGSKRWSSSQLMEDGVKAELFEFVPATDHNLLDLKDFGVYVSLHISSAGTISILIPIIVSFRRVLAAFAPRWFPMSNHVQVLSSASIQNSLCEASLARPRQNAAFCWWIQRVGIRSLHQSFFFMQSVRVHVGVDF